LPNVNPVNLRIPNKYFGDFVTIYEFFHNFWTQLDAGSYFPQGISIELLERCLVEQEITGTNIRVFFLFWFPFISRYIKVIYFIKIISTL